MPILVKCIFGVINDPRQHGVIILLVEQNACEALKVVDRAHVLESRRIILYPLEQLAKADRTKLGAWHRTNCLDSCSHLCKYRSKIRTPAITI
jgi:ABC-type Mn2+/Zn2+ transport system ATPase subunit